MSRSSEYTPEIADLICARLASGESLRSVCRDESMPCVATVFNWLRSQPQFLEQYARAKEESADALADEMLEIADDGTNDWMKRHTKDDEDAAWVVNGEHIQRSRVRIDTRKWLASKLKPKKYGEKIDHTHTGPNGGPVVTRVELVAMHVDRADPAT
jgi:hypothetical protein